MRLGNIFSVGPECYDLSKQFDERSPNMDSVNVKVKGLGRIDLISGSDYLPFCSQTSFYQNQGSPVHSSP